MEKKSRRGNVLVLIIVLVVIVIIGVGLWLWLRNRSASSVPIVNFSAVKTYSSDTLPPLFPISFPLVDKIQNTGSASVILSGGLTESTVGFTSSRNPQLIYNFYKNYFVTNGWVVTSGSRPSSSLVWDLSASNLKNNTQIIVISYASSSVVSTVSVQYYSR